MSSPTPKPDQPPVSGQLCLGDVTVDLARRKVLRGSEEESLTSIEAKLLSYLAGRLGQVVTKADLYTDVWGYSATTISRAAEKAIVRLRKKIEARPDDPEYLLTVWGEGWCLRGDGHAQEATGGRAGTNVPSETRVVVPRPESDQIAAELRGSRRLVTLTGPGGMGKTTLAQGVALSLHREGLFEGGVWWVDLSESHSGTDLVLSAASSLGYRVQGSDLAADVVEIGQHLVGMGPTLLVLDNCEQVVEATAEVLSSWLADVPGLKVLATSRLRLRLSSELVVAMAPLGARDSIALFAQRARASGAVLEDTDPALPGLVDGLAGLPLAIEIAAAHVGLLGPAALARRLGERLMDLDTRRRDSEDRHKSLEVCLSISWELLDSSCQKLLALTSAFRGGFTLEAAESILAPAVDDREVYEVIQDLVDHSLLWVCPAGDAMRMQLLATTRSFVHRRCAELSEQDPAFARLVVSTKSAHAHWFGRFVEEETADGPERRATAQQLPASADDLGNLCAAVDYAIELDQPSDAVGAFLAAVPVFLLSARGLEQAIEVGTRIRQCLELEPDLLAFVLRDVARAQWRLSRPSEAQGLARELLSLVEAGQAQSMRIQAFVLMSTVDWGDTEAAEAWLLRALEEADRLGLDGKLAHILADLGSVYGRSARWELADEALSRGLVLAEKWSDTRAKSGLLYQRGDVNRARGRLGAALRDFEASRALYQRRGNLSRVALLGHSMAAVHMLCGRPEEAKVLLQQVLEQEPVAAPRRTANRARITMAMCLLTEGMQGCAAAEQLIRHLVTDDASEPSPWIRAPALLVQVDIDVLRKEWASAVGHLEAYVALYEGLQSPEFVALGGGGLALVRARQGRLQEAEVLVAQALEGWPRSCPYEYATLLCWAAEVYVLGQKHEAAKEAMAEARRWMEEMQVGSASPLGRALAEATAVFDASTPS